MPGNLASSFHGVTKIDDTQAKDLKDGRWHSTCTRKFPCWRNSRTRRPETRVFGFAVLVAFWSMASFALAADAEAGKRIFRRPPPVSCGSALHWQDRTRKSAEFLANPRRFKPTTGTTFPGLRSQKDIDDVIAYITAN